MSAHSKALRKKLDLPRGKKKVDYHESGERESDITKRMKK